MIAVMFFNRENAWRRTLNWMGIIISSAYMVFTIVMKFMALSDFKRSLADEGIAYEDISTRPTPLNCILWTANVDLGDAYLMGYHSFFDSQPISWHRVEKNHELLGDLAQTEEVERLWHLTAGEYAVTLRKDTVVYNDLRFGMFGEPAEGKDFVFAYKVFREGDEVKVEEIPPPRPSGEEGKLAMIELWERIKGN
jgi:inner membrane protein